MKLNRENKRKLFEKNYYKSHACNKDFICKVCGRLVTAEGAGSQHRNHCPNCLSSQHLDVEPGDRAADCGGVRRLQFGSGRTASGQLYTGAKFAGR